MRRLRASGRYLLGLFVLVQLAFLPFANLTGVENALRHAARRRQAFPAWAEGGDGLDVRAKSAVRSAAWWGRLTGQEQPWQLFAPDTVSIVAFPVVELHWAGGESVVLPSANRPADRHAFFRLGGFRARRAGAAVDVAPYDEDAAFDPSGPAWRETISRLAWADRPGLRAYLRWRVGRYLDAAPGVAWPDEVFLSTELWRIPEPPGPTPWDWTPLGTHPVLRWDPADGTVRLFDPAAGSYGEALP
jgi:hypothetical protein